jgi:hypothetical protein
MTQTTRTLTIEEQKIPVSLKLKDIVLIYSIINSCSSKNLFSPREYTDVGNLFKLCETIIKEKLKLKT